jgi:predicted RNA polymerase sigma factor
VLLGISDNPMARVSHAIAVAMSEGPDAGLQLLETLDADPRIAGHFRLDAVRGHLHERRGDLDKAKECFTRAAERTANVPERDYLRVKAAALAADRKD